MPGLSAKGLVKSYEGTTIIDSATLAINEGDKTALVGENGAGKSVLLRTLSGIEQPTRGNIYYDEWAMRYYVAQEFSGSPDETALDFLGVDMPLHKVAKQLNLAGFPEDSVGLPSKSLSGGQRKILELARAFVRKPDFLFLDEPENHLDYNARDWLIKKMVAYRGAIVFVSHDQYLIDEVANKILELEDGDLKTYPGSYQEFLEIRKRDLEAEIRQWKHQDHEIKRHRAMVAELRQRARVSDQFSSSYHNKEKMLARLESEHSARPVVERPRIKLNVQGTESKTGKRIVTIRGMSLEYHDPELDFRRMLFQDANVEIIFGEKVCLFGRNGSGKTSLFKMILGELEPTKGKVTVGVNINLGYFSQEHDEDLDYQKTPLELIMSTLGVTEGKARAILGRFLLDGSAIKRRISTLSGGQKTRLRFAKLFTGKYDFLLLDEPTNNLDRGTWEVLVEAIKDFNGTVLLVSHDRTFVDQTVQKLWVLEGGQISEYLGSLTNYLEDGLG